MSRIKTDFRSNIHTDYDVLKMGLVKVVCIKMKFTAKKLSQGIVFLVFYKRKAYHLLFIYSKMYTFEQISKYQI